MKLQKSVFIIIISVLMLSLLASCSSNGEENASDGGDIQKVKIAAVDWGFEPNEVTVKQGKVKLIIENQGKRMHGFGIKELNIDVRLGPGERKEEIIELNQPGTYEFDCTVICGTLEQHHEMKGTIIVE